MSRVPSQQTELHRHLDVSARLSTVHELAIRRGLIPQSTSLESFGEKIFLRKPLQDLAEVLATFSLFQDILDRPETLERIAFEVAEDCWLEGTHRVDLRYSPSFACEKSGLKWEEALDAFHRGITRAMKKYPDLKAGLICIASRDYGTESVAETAEFFLRHRDRLIGFDLAGNEVGFPCRKFESAVKPLRAAGARITVHAGEATGPENVWEAIELLGARRIGHGIASIRDPQLMERLARDGICLEMCPTSNWLTQAVPSFEAHPLPQVLRAGVPVCINTDDPGVFAVTLKDEITIARTRMGMSDAEIRRCQDHAWQASFLN